MLKLLPKKKYQDMLDTIEFYEKKNVYLEMALDSTDKCLCDTRQEKYDLNLALEYANESYKLLKIDYDRIDKELDSKVKYISCLRECIDHNSGVYDNIRSDNKQLVNELKLQKKTNRRLINLLYNPKKK